MGVKLKNWDAVGKLFTITLPEVIDNQLDRAIDRAQKTYSQAILDILAEQPSDWTPKGEEWQVRSGSSDLFYGETGEFVMDVTDEAHNSRGIRAKMGDKKVFVGARHDVIHTPSGLPMDKIAGILQNTPGPDSRDLFGKAYDRVEAEILKEFRDIKINLK